MTTIIPDPLVFDWDKGNQDKNFFKHQVTTQEAEEVFVNEPLIISPDPSHSLQEPRHIGLGKTNSGRLLFVSFTLRLQLLRIISVRDMNQKERKIYEKV